MNEIRKFDGRTDNQFEAELFFFLVQNTDDDAATAAAAAKEARRIRERAFAQEAAGLAVSGFKKLGMDIE